MIFMQIDVEFEILWNFEVLKNVCGSSNFRKIWAIVHKYNTSIKDLWYWILRKSIAELKFFSDFEFFENLL